MLILGKPTSFFQLSLFSQVKNNNSIYYCRRKLCSCLKHTFHVLYENRYMYQIVDDAAFTSYAFSSFTEHLGRIKLALKQYRFSELIS